MLRWLLALLLGLPLFFGSAGVAAATPDELDATDNAWALIRANTPADREVYRPTWLPARFTQAGIPSPRPDGITFGITYTSTEGDILFFGSWANSCGDPDGTSARMTIRGYPGWLIMNKNCQPRIEIWWQEGAYSHSIKGISGTRANAVSREELLRIVEGVVPVGADGRAQTSAGPPAQECFAATGQCIGGGFLDRWRATGGTAINGLPLSGEFRQKLEDGNEYTVQYFERVRMEYHPENPAPYDILLGQFGRAIHPADPPVAADPQAPRFFPATGHNISGQFFGYWENYGGVAQFGLPLTEEITERLEDGKEYRVQYFERARFELHPENQYPYNVLLGQFGRQILATAPTASDAAPLWQSTGAMAAPRAQHSATRLNDGRVLVAGGNTTDGDGTAASAELYDPQTGRWSPTGAMTAPRTEHAALLLPDGQVLVVGGFNYSVYHNTTSVTTAERYNPATGLWHLTTAPPVGIGLASAALLTDGRALIVVTSPTGTAPADQAVTALLYDSQNDRWTSLGTVALAGMPAVVALADGRALLLGAVGQINDGTTPALLLDPKTGQTIPSPLPDGRGGHAAILLPDGTVMVVGGVAWPTGTDTVTLDTALILDPTTGRWSAGPSLGIPRVGFALIALADGRVLAVGGNNPTGPAQATAEFYDPQVGSWTGAGTVPGSVRARFAVAPLADDRALVVGGDAGFVRSEWLTSAELFTPPAR